MKDIANTTLTARIGQEEDLKNLKCPKVLLLVNSDPVPTDPNIKYQCERVLVFDGEKDPVIFNSIATFAPTHKSKISFSSAFKLVYENRLDVTIADVKPWQEKKKKKKEKWQLPFFKKKTATEVEVVG